MSGVWSSCEGDIVYYWNGWETIAAEDKNKEMQDRDAEKPKDIDYGYGWIYGFGSWTPPKKELTPEEKHAKKQSEDLDKAFRKAKY